MITQDQSELIDFLSNKKTFHQNKEVLVHRSALYTLFLTQTKAYKLKRALLSTHTDFSTPEKRKLACLNEIKRGAIYATKLKQTLKTVRKVNGKFTLNATEGEEVDSLIEMKRLPSECFFSELLNRNKLDKRHILSLTESLVDLHNKAKVYHQKQSPDIFKNLINETEVILNDFAPLLFKISDIQQWATACHKQLKKLSSLIIFRQKSGRVKKCHGDLFLSNIAVFKKKFMFFSPLEHNTVLECVDCLYDLSSILIELEAIGKRPFANLLLNHYMSFTNDLEGIPLLGLYQSLRGARRAIILAQKAVLSDPEKKKELFKQASALFNAACRVLEPTPAVLIACGGLPKVGKTTITQNLAPYFNPAPGAILLRDEVIKKQIRGLMPQQHFEKTTDSPSFNTVLYAVLVQQVKAILSAHSSVIIDANLTQEAQRTALTQVATDLNIPFVGLWIKEANGKEKLPLSAEEKFYWHTIKTKPNTDQTIQYILKILQKNN